MAYDPAESQASQTLDEVLAAMGPGSRRMAAEDAAAHPQAQTPMMGQQDQITSPDIVVTGHQRVAQHRDQISAAPAADMGLQQMTSDLFGVTEQRANDAVGAVRTQASTLSNVFDSAEAGLQALQDQKLAEATRAVAAKQKITESVMGDTERVLGEVRPLFAARAAIADRAAKVQGMNPLVRAIHGIFDRNYSPEYLAKSEAAIDGEIQVRGAEFERINQLQNRLLEGVSSNSAGAVSLMDLQGENLNQDIALAATKLQYRRGELSDIIAGVGATTEITRAQALARDSTLSQLDGASLNAAIAQATKGGGRAMVNGAELSTAELKGRQRDLYRQELALTAAKQEVTSGSLRIQSQRMGLASQSEELALSHMSFTETQQAFNNDGMFKGHKFNQAALGARLNQLNAGIDASVEAGSGVNVVRQTGQVAQQFGDRLSQLGRRAASLFGRNAPPDVLAMLHRGTQLLNDTGTTIRESSGPNAAKTIGVRGAEMMRGLQEVDQFIDKLAQRTTRNPDAQIAIGGWLKGNPLTPEQATNAAIAFAGGGGLPPGVKLGGPAAAAFAAGKRAMDGLQQSQEYVKADAAGKRRMLQSAVSGAMSQQWNGQHTDLLVGQMPSLARSMNDPFGRMISPEDFARARASGDKQGYAAFAESFNQQHNTNLSADQARLMFGPNGQQVVRQVNQTRKPEDRIDSSSLAQMHQQLIAYQTSAWMQNLDQIGGMGTSRAFAKFMQRSDVQTRVGQVADSLGDDGLGSMLADNVAGGGVRGRFASASQLLVNQVRQNEAAALTHTRAQIGNYGRDPMTRTAAVLAAIPGIDQHGEAILLRALREHGQAGMLESGVESAASAMGGSMAGAAVRGYGNTQRNMAIANAIKSSKFQDPSLERVRKVAAQHWDTYSEATDRAVGSLGGNR